MSSERHARAKAIFLTASELPPEQRAGFVQEASGSDSALVQDVLSLLHAQAGRVFHSNAAKNLIGSAVELDPSLLVGRTFGRFTIVRHLGAGGMGHVFEAIQTNPDRPVALKVMKSLLATPQVLRRFEWEVEILARLSHSGIAHVYEAGTFEVGGSTVPYFAMEYIPEARPLTEFAAAHRLGIRDRVSLVATVCDAVQHGHQIGIVHRDLKPGNILVDEYGQPKIIDFGVARATQSDVAVTTMHTQFGALIGTLQYMSPEQCEGDPNAPDTRTDVYSLGIILYQLLCGQLPYIVPESSIVAAVQTIRESQPPPPGKLNRGLGGNIEAILLRALSKNPEQRYSTAGDLGRDLRRHLSGEPVEARVPGAWSRAIRWTVRHPAWATTALCVGVATLIWGSIGLSFYWISTRPASVTIDPSGSIARLESKSGAILKEWRDPRKRPFVLGSIVDRPQELGGGTAIVLAQQFGPDAAAEGELRLHPVDDPDRILWTSRSSPLILPPGERERKEASFLVSIAELLDVLPQSPGLEIVVVHELTPYSARAIRVYDLAGRVRFEVWHDGGLGGVRWLPDSGRLLVAGLESQYRWDERGVKTSDEFGSRYPSILFTLKIEDGHVDHSRWIMRSGRLQDPLLQACRWWGPPKFYETVGDFYPIFEDETGNWPGQECVRVHFAAFHGREDKLQGGVHLTINADLGEVARFTDDNYKKYLRRGEVPEDGGFRLLDYSELPPPIPPQADSRDGNR